MPTTFTHKIRRARLEDLSKVSQLEKRVWKQMSARRNVIQRRFFLFPQGFIVATVGSEIAGFCCACLYDVDATKVPVDAHFPPGHIPGADYYFIFALTVNPIYRGHGIGTDLVRRELKQARKRGCKKAQVFANKHSRTLFERLDFQASAKLDSVFKGFEKLMQKPVLMELELKADPDLQKRSLSRAVDFQMR